MRMQKYCVRPKKLESFAFAFYEGREPGVYSTLGEVKAQITGYIGQRYRVFVTLAVAYRAYTKYCVKENKLPRLGDDSRKLYKHDKLHR